MTARCYTRCALLVLLSALASSCALAASYTVNPGGSIQAAINSAVSGDTITVQPGTYTGNLNFNGKNLTLCSSNPGSNSTVESTILDGGAAGPVVTFNHGETHAALLDGFTIRNGKAALGAGIYCSGASPTIRRNQIADNHAQTVGVTGKGGGLMVSGGAPLISHNTFSGNVADLVGGGVYLANCGGTMEWSYITESQARDGAGVALNGVTTALTSVTINYGVATRNGGALLLTGTSGASLQNLFVENSSALRGGGLYCGGGGNTGKIVKSIFIGNTADDGGAVYVADGALTLERDTLVGNSSGCFFAGGTAVVNSCIVAFSTVGPGASRSGGAATVRYTDLWSHPGGNYVGMSAGTGCLSADPLFVDWHSGNTALKSQGGRTYVATVYDDVTSPCVDAGDPALDFSLEPAPNGSRVNMGDLGNTAMASRSFVSMLSNLTPANGATGTNRRGSVILCFAQAMKQASVQSHFSLTPEGGSAVTGTFTWRTPKRVVYFKPSAPLAASTKYSVHLADGIVRNDDSVVAWSETDTFTTGAQPVVLTATPTGTGVARATNLVLTFDVGMNHASVENNLTLTPNAACTYTWAPGSKQVTVNPNSNLAASTKYTAQLAAAARSAAGVDMQFAYSWTFTTGASAPPQVLAAASAGGAGAATVSVTLSAPARVSAVVLNAAGRTLAALGERQLEAGVSRLSWSGRNGGGTVVPAGTYFVRLTARDGSGASSSAVAVLRLQRP